MRRMGKGKMACLVGLGLIVGALAVVCWFLWPRERVLTQTAHSLLALNPNREEIDWLSDSQFLIVTTDQGNSERGNWQGHADLFDTTTQTRSRQTGLSDLFSRTDMSPWGHPYEFELSPKGTWVHWFNVPDRHGHMSKPACAKLDGSHLRKLPAHHYGRPTHFWLDDQHYVEVAREVSPDDKFVPAVVEVYDIQNPDGDKRYPASSEQAKAILKQYYEAHPTMIGAWTRDQKAIEVFRTQDIDDMADSRPEKPLRSYPLVLPDSAELEETKISPEQTTLLYHLRITKAPPLQAWLHRFLPFVPANPITTEGLWVSRADGTGLRELGHVYGKLDANGSYQPQIDAVQWLPGSKQVSFLYRDMLYIVRAEATLAR